MDRQSIVEEERIKGAKDSLDAVGIKVVTEKEDLPIDDPKAVRRRNESDFARASQILKGLLPQRIILPFLC